MSRPRAVLDHVGIAVRNLDEALAFYRDALGLEIVESEEVASQRVRAHFVPAGGASLELLEPTAPDSPIAKYVDDVAAAVERLTGLGVRLIDERPRPGAEGALIAFVHPSAAHGVLVELKQASASAHAATRQRREWIVRRFGLGDVELVSLCDGFIGLDGGSMFGTIPKPLWEKQTAPDARNRITLAMRPLIVRGARTMLIDAGLGGKDDAKFHDIYAVDRRRSLDDALAEAGIAPDGIDIVLATHLHFDHAGGFTVRDAAGRVRPRFPRAQYIVRRGEWEDATHPHARNRASYLRDNYVPLADAGVLQLVDEDATIMPGVRVQRTGGHTMHHQMIWIESAGKTAAFPADLVPTTAHLPDPWIMGYDLYPMDTLAAKRAFVKTAIERQALVFFEHDPVVAAGYLREREGARTVDHV
jgi:methylmalonyl-CoA epimerase